MKALLTRSTLVMAPAIGMGGPLTKAKSIAAMLPPLAPAAVAARSSVTAVVTAQGDAPDFDESKAGEPRALVDRATHQGSGQALTLVSMALGSGICRQSLTNAW